VRDVVKPCSLLLTFVYLLLSFLSWQAGQVRLQPVALGTCHNIGTPYGEESFLRTFCTKPTRGSLKRDAFSFGLALNSIDAVLEPP
jgi:hypothetical protein